MKNKKSLYILIPTVIIIWGLIIYKILNYKSKSFIPAQNVISQNTIDTIKTEMDTLPFIASYRDPFLGRMKNVTSKKVEKNDRRSNYNRSNYQQKTPVAMPYVNWPKIDYNGMIYSKEKKEQLALININRNDYLMQINQEIEQCTLLAIYPDSVIMRFKHIKKTYYK